MSERIPRSAREALARQTAADEHPSADLLNGFLEHALGADENARVTTHLAACADCREIVFLAGTAVEDEQQVAVAARAVAANVPSAAAAADVREVSPQLASFKRPRFAWLSWKWVVPAVTVVAIVAIVVVDNNSRSSIDTARTVAMNSGSSVAAPPAQTNALSATIAGNDKAPPTPLSPAEEKKSKAAVEAWLKEEEARRKELEAKRELYQRQQLSSSLEIEPNAKMASPPPNATAGGFAGRATADAVTSQKSMAKGVAPQAMAKTAPQAARAQAVPSASQTVETPALSNFVQNAPRGGNDITYTVQPAPRAAPQSQWRIGDDGHLQRANASGQWTPVLSDQAVFFHTVATIGGDVWAGGSDGTLFHSTDNGEHWTRIALVADGQAAHGAIRSIRLATPTAGLVTTDAGETWTTSDGGKTWSKN